MEAVACLLAVVMAGLVGLGLLVDSLWRSSATYDEVAYLRLAAQWWRTGKQDGMTRMGSPLTFWKLQQVPVLWMLDHTGHRAVVDDPIGHQRFLLPLARIGSLWIWVVGLGLTAAWSHSLYGPRAMALAAWLFALSPNILAHGNLATMELPLVAGTTAMLFLFWSFLRTRESRWLVLSAIAGGLAFSCKFTTAVIPPMLGVLWWLDRWRQGERGIVKLTLRVLLGMVCYGIILIAADLVVTGFATLPLAHSRGAHPSFDGRFGAALGPWVSRAAETPIPQDWVGFATQIQHQRSGGSSYLFGARRMTGWWYYYFVALAVKVPLTFWVLAAGRSLMSKREGTGDRDWMLPTAIGLFLTITALGSSRNYGVRYLLPLAPLAIVWVSALADGGGAWARRVACLGLAGQALAVASIHPYELTYFNRLAGGPIDGRHVLADSNLDWGQGLRDLARLQQTRPELSDLTLYYFGDTDPRHYGVVGRCYTVDAADRHSGLPESLSADTKYLAVSASLQWGPWGPERYFRSLDHLRPVLFTDDKTIAIYRVRDWLGTRPTE